jgi:hypothetical protein
MPLGRLTAFTMAAAATVAGIVRPAQAADHRGRRRTSVRARHGVRVKSPAELGPAISEALGQRNLPSVLDVEITRDPARMLPGVDSRTVRLVPGDRIA